MRLPFRKPGKYTQIKSDPIITRSKFEDLKNNLKKLKKVRPEVVKEVARLAELGDFSENVEYQLAKGRLRGINSRILKLERQIADAQIISTTKNNIIQIGSVVTIESDGKQKIYQILGSSETNPEKGIVSHSSPIGSALLNHEVGDMVSVKIADKQVDYKIIAIK